MVLVVRIYKRFDADLLSLAVAGYPLSEMIKGALIGYASGSPAKYSIDNNTGTSFDNTKSFRIRVNLKKGQDDIAIRLLEAVKSGYRNTFAKMILRDSLVRQNVTCFLDTNKLGNMALQPVQLIQPIQPIYQPPVVMQAADNKVVVSEVAAKPAKVEAKKEPVSLKKMAQAVPVETIVSESEEKYYAKEQKKNIETDEDDINKLLDFFDGL